MPSVVSRSAGRDGAHRLRGPSSSLAVLHQNVCSSRLHRWGYSWHSWCLHQWTVAELLLGVGSVRVCCEESVFFVVN